ncbi:hypothetical protein [Actinoplanes sp. ATCC 53533]|uniref:hypothetical protein n=1 Tax=Actinoplanes sp. ATCC 53533 TaxID=1288362 RepID=UPI000F771D41|nr:hypothetical protein [Actinoplanes sp. ATCC 53533]
MACRICRHVLDRHTDFPSGAVSFRHPIWLAAGHRPDPVRADTIEARFHCDFCNDEKIMFAYATASSVRMLVDTGTEFIARDYGTHWAACFECAELFDAPDLQGLLDRILCAGPFAEPLVAGHLRDLTAKVMATRLPGKTLSTGGWAPVAVPAATLPKVRDRLTHLLGDGHELPFGLGEPGANGPLLTGLSTARMYWIDDEFTALTEQLAADLPPVHVTPDHLPAPQGLLAWSQPVGDRIVAVSWTTHGDGVQVVGYRSVGAGLPPLALQRLREQVGWLVPAFAVMLAPGQIVDGGHPVAALVTTWRLIRQRLAETVPVRIDRSIRKAYERAQRPEPEVRLVRLRGRAGKRPVAAATSGPGRSADRDFRWWVGAFWRYQPIGPGRADYDWRAVRAHVRGPDDRPIKASTTVRILSALPSRPTREKTPH